MTHKLVDALSRLQEEEVLAEVTALKERNVPIFDIIQLLQEGMSLVGKRFLRNSFLAIISNERHVGRFIRHKGRV